MSDALWVNGPANWRGVSVVTAIRIKGAFEQLLRDAKAARSKGATLRERIAAAAVVIDLEAALAGVVRHLASIRRDRGWSHLARGNLPHATPTQGGRRMRPKGAAPADGAGVPGAEPSAAMGQGWPAFLGAGSAASRPSQREDAAAVVQGKEPPT